MLDGLELIAGRVALSVLADDAVNAKEIWDAGAGSVIPALAAARHQDERELSEAVRACVASIPLVSVALGGNADVSQWHKVLVGGQNGAHHLNQPFSTAGFAKGACGRAWVNGVVTPSSTRSRVLVSTLGAAKHELDMAVAMQLASEAQLDAVKVHPAVPELSEGAIFEIGKATSEAGIAGFEPAGGLDFDTTPRLLARLLEIPDLLLLPHVFGAVRDQDGRTSPALVAKLVNRVIAATK